MKSRLGDPRPYSVALAVLMVAVTLAQASAASGNAPVVTVTALQTIDTAGNPQSSFAPGSEAEININLTVTSQVNLHVILECFYGSTVATPLVYHSTSVSAGQTIGIYLPCVLDQNAAAGTYTAWVFFWNGYPGAEGANWVAYANPAHISFTVT